VHAAASTPPQRPNVLLHSIHPEVSVFPDRIVGSTCALARTLALSPIRDALIEGFSQFVTGWSDCRVGFAAPNKSAAFARRTPDADIRRLDVSLKGSML
jgi:hypothetical protein